MVPERRDTIDGVEVFIADGYSARPELKFKKFGVEPGEYSWGCYVTLWWISKDDDLDVGQPIFFDAMHDPEFDTTTKKHARINTALKTATEFIERRKKAALNG